MDGRGGIELLDSPPVHDEHPAAQLEGLADIVGHEEKGLLRCAVDGEETVLQAFAIDGVDGAEGLIQKHDGRIGREGPGQADSLLLPAGKLSWVAAAKFVGVEVHEGEQRVDACPDARRIPAEDGRHGGDVFGDVLMGEEPHLLNHIADALAQRDGIFIGDGFAIQQNPAAVRLDQPVDEPDQGGLAAARGAEDGDQLAGFNHEADAVEGGRGRAGEGFGDGLKGNCCGHGAPF